MFCKYCGAQVNEGALYCAKCGGSLPERPAEASAPAAPQPPAEEAKPETKQKKKNAGAVIAVLCVLLAACLAVIGWFIYDKFFKPDDDQTTQSTAGTSATQPVTESVPAPTASEPQQTAAIEPTTEAPAPPAAPEPAPGSPLTVEDFRFTYKGVTYSYPFTPDQFTEERGWTLTQGDPDRILEADHGNTIVYTCDEFSIGFQYENTSNTTLPIQETWLMGFGIMFEDMSDPASVIFSRGITGASNRSDILTAFGKPDVDEGSDVLIYLNEAIAYPEDIIGKPGYPMIFGLDENNRILGVIFGIVGGGAKADPDSSSTGPTP